MAEIPGWYSGIAHLALVNLSCFAVIAACVWALEAPRPALLAVALGTLVFANVFEWWVHKGPLHRPWKGLFALYDRHARTHHVAFTDEDMAVQHTRELRFVLFPPWLFPLFLVMTAPGLAALWKLGGLDVGLTYVASAVAYYVIYEWLHTLHHWPRDSWIGRRALVSRLRRHHERHHEPARMTSGNWNVSFPLADVLFRTVLPEAAPQKAGAAAPPKAEPAVAPPPG